MKAGTAPILRSEVKNGVVPLPRGVRLAEGTAVHLVPLTPLSTDPPFLKGMLQLAKPRHWPRDFALNHAHHVKRHPKR